MPSILRAFGFRVVLIVVIGLSSLGRAAEDRPPMSQEQMTALLEKIDDRQRNSGDYRWEGVIYQKERGKEDTAYEATVYRRDESDQFMILFTAPKSEAGKGYLRLEKNLFRYDPSVGRWERTTERERILGTNTRRADFDESRLADEYDPRFVAHEKLGVYDVAHLQLTAKQDADVAYPVVELWVDEPTGNILKRQDYALSGKKLRTLYTPKWNSYFSESKGTDVYVPAEIRVYDELEPGNSTLVRLQKVDLRRLPTNIFTKAWFESKSR